MSGNLVLVEVKERFPEKEQYPAAFHASEAAWYIGTNREQFKGLVRSGLIPFSFHANGKTRIYLRAHLDDYLKSRGWRTMSACENPLTESKLKGVG